MPDGSRNNPIEKFLGEKMDQLDKWMILEGVEYNLKEHGTPQVLKLDQNPALVKFTQKGLGLMETGKVDRDMIVEINTILRSKYDAEQAFLLASNPDNAFNQPAFKGIKDSSEVTGAHLALVFEQMREKGMIKADDPQSIKAYADALRGVDDFVIKGSVKSLDEVVQRANTQVKAGLEPYLEMHRSVNSVSPLKPF